MAVPDNEYISSVINGYYATYTQVCTDPIMLTSPTENPYWESVKELSGEKDWQGHWEPKRLFFNREGVDEQRERLVRQYAWAIPDPATLQFVAEHAHGPVVEMGSGTGYWSWQLEQLGIHVTPYDIAPPDKVFNRFHAPPCVSIQDPQVLREVRDELLAGKQPHILSKIWNVVYQGTPEVLARYPDRTLFLCWPPYGGSMATECLEHYKGDRLIYIGEGQGGCNADDNFFAALEKDWEEVASHRPIQWEAIHDWVTVYDRIDSKKGE